MSTTRSPSTDEDIKFLINALRQASVKWSGRKECLALARKKVFVRRSKKGKAIYKYHWQCAVCENWFDNEGSMEVDHIIEFGGYTGHNGDWNETIQRLFPRPIADHLQALCVPCHLRKTGLYNSARKKWKRKT